MRKKQTFYKSLQLFLLMAGKISGGEVLPHMSSVGVCGGPRVWFLSGFGEKRDIHLTILD